MSLVASASHLPPHKARALSIISLCALLSLGLMCAPLAEVSARGGVSLRGSSTSLDRQNQAARRAGLKRLKSKDAIQEAVRLGKLVRVRDERHFKLNRVSYPYAHPSMRSFLRRFAAFYQRTCGADLVITSLLRPLNLQKKLRNGSSRSVHPTGIAADLRRPWRACRERIEPVLLELEREQVIEATRERRPPHYHITINPEGFERALKRGDGRLRALHGGRSTRSTRSARSARSTPKRSKTDNPKRRAPKRRSPKRRALTNYRVRSGDTLWALAQRWRVSVKQIKRINRLRSNSLQIGQQLKRP